MATFSPPTPYLLGSNCLKLIIICRCPMANCTLLVLGSQFGIQVKSVESQSWAHARQNGTSASLWDCFKSVWHSGEVCELGARDKMVLVRQSETVLSQFGIQVKSVESQSWAHARQNGTIATIWDCFQANKISPVTLLLNSVSIYTILTPRETYCS